MDPTNEFGRGGLNRFVDASGLTDRIGLDDEEIAWRKSFIGFDEDDERRLAAMEPLFRDNQDAIADAFYDNLTQYDQTIEVISRSPKGIEELKRTQKAYLVSLATGDYDEAYFQNRALIGKLHELLDMPLKQYVGQYGLYYDLILSRVDERVQGQVVEAVEEWAAERDDEAGLARVVAALGGGGGDDEGLDDSFEETIRAAIHDGMQDVLAVLRILNLDLQVASDTYVDSYAQRLADAVDTQQELAREVERDLKPPVVQLRRSSTQVADGAATVHDHASEQATAATGAAADVEEVSAAAEEVASVAAGVRETSESAAEAAGDGREAGERALDALAEVEATTERLKRAAETVEERASDIEAVVEGVDDIVDRTAVLATNAKVEAKRTNGDGPAATIADELSSFVTRTRSDLDEIEDAAETVRAEAAETRTAVDEAADAVADGREEVTTAVETIEDLEDVVADAAAGMEEVDAATSEQAERVTALSESVTELAERADAVAAEAEEIAAASDQQADSARTVAAAVEKLPTEPIDEEEAVYERI